MKVRLSKQQVYSPPSSLIFGDDEQGGGEESRESTSPSPSGSSSDHSDLSDDDAPANVQRPEVVDAHPQPVKKSVRY